MARQKIPRELQDIAALLKHPGMDQKARQQLADQLTEEERLILGIAKPRQTPGVEPSSELKASHVPAPLKLVTSWPVQVRDLELPQPVVPLVTQPELVLDELVQEPSSELISPRRMLTRLGAGAAMLWPWVLIAAAALTLVVIGCRVIVLAR